MKNKIDILRHNDSKLVRFLFWFLSLTIVSTIVVGISYLFALLIIAHPAMFGVLFFAILIGITSVYLVYND